MKAPHDLTKADLNNLSQKMDGLVEKMGIAESLIQPRDIMTTYRGKMDIVIGVSSGKDQITTEKGALILEKGVGFGIPPIMYEDEILPVTTTDNKALHTKAEVIKNIVKSRQDVNKALQGKVYHTGSAFVEARKGLKYIWGPMDDTFPLVIEFFKVLMRGVKRSAMAKLG